ncbi:sensor histidine kinase [Streptomyces inhibens]|uniref:sensor histidine kinase n=1 Tax=Streptomyces inhibens TaxID=2293571 RepID=UPI001EE6FAAB|nr:ATP-binding protein [Streptomyces inhibens]UKY54947.1 hypothetical protein KI385_43485 [Streptomyces inhibens]
MDAPWVSVYCRSTSTDRTNWPDVIRGTLSDAERLEQLTDDLLLLADLDNRTPPITHPVELGALTRKAATQARRHAPTHVQIDCPAGDNVTVRGDARQLERLLRNLVDNAVRHARTRVLITVSTHDATALIEVCDDGPGIPAEHRERIFERFTRLDASRNRTSGGTGLGLAIAREIAHRHRGALTLNDPAPAGGAHFVAELPLTPDTATAPSTASGAPGQPPSDGTPAFDDRTWRSSGLRQAGRARPGRSRFWRGAVGQRRPVSSALWEPVPPWGRVAAAAPAPVHRPWPVTGRRVPCGGRWSGGRRCRSSGRRRRSG